MRTVVKLVLVVCCCQTVFLVAVRNDINSQQQKDQNSGEKSQTQTNKKRKKTTPKSAAAIIQDLPFHGDDNVLRTQSSECKVFKWKRPRKEAERVFFEDEADQNGHAEEVYNDADSDESSASSKSYMSIASRVKRMNANRVKKKKALNVISAFQKEHRDVNVDKSLQRIHKARKRLLHANTPGWISKSATVPQQQPSGKKKQYNSC